MSDFILHNYDIYAVAQFYPWFQLYFLLFQTHYHNYITIPNNERKKIKTMDKIKPQHIQVYVHVNKEQRGIW